MIFEELQGWEIEGAYKHAGNVRGTEEMYPCCFCDGYLHLLSCPLWGLHLPSMSSVSQSSTPSDQRQKGFASSNFIIAAEILPLSDLTVF